MEFPNWFEQTAQSNFEALLTPLAGKPDLEFLQIGAFTGDATLWLMENILTHESSYLVDVDTWEGSDEDAHHNMDFKEVLDVYINKTKKYTLNRFIYRMTSATYFRQNDHKRFDFIYIDGDHTANGVIEDAILAWRLLKPGGIIAFDDYTWQHPDGELFMPKTAINFFIWLKQREIEILASNSQLWIRKNLRNGI